MSNNLKVQYVGHTPFSTGGSPPGNQRQAMSYVMSYPLAMHHQGEEQEAVLPSRSGANFFKQHDDTAKPEYLRTAAQQSVAYDGRDDVAEFRQAAKLQDGQFPRDTLHPLISQLQAEENAKYASFHPEVGFLANARRTGPPCAAHKPPAFLTSTRGRSEGGTNEYGEEDDHDAEVDLAATRNKVRFYSKRGDLSTVSGRRFYTEGNVEDADHYASTIAEFANTQPTSFTAIAAKALGNAIHINKPTGKQSMPPSYKVISPELKTVLAHRNRSGRHQIEAVILGKHSLMQPPPLKADKGVDVNAVSIPYDPFADRHFKAVNDKPDSIDQRAWAAADKEEVLGTVSQTNLWSKFVDGYRETTVVAAEAKGMRVLASGHVSFYSGITQAPSVSRFLTSKGIRQGDGVKQPTQLSKSSFLETGVIPCSQFTDLELVPPNAVGLDTERFAILIRNYGKDLREIFLEGCTWITAVSLSLVATYCPNLELLNLAHCPQVTDTLIAAIAAKCNRLKAVNLSGSRITHVGLRGLLANTSLQGLFLSGVEGLTATCDAAWTELYKHRDMKYFDGSFSFHLTDTAVVSLGQHCRKLEVLNLSGCSNLSDASMYTIGYSLKHLKSLNVRLCSQFTAPAINSIGLTAKGLVDLNLSGLLCITTLVVEELLARCPVIKRLWLRSCNKVDDETLAQLGRRCGGLEELDISGCIRVTLAGLMQLIHDQKTLKKVNISDTKFSGAEERILCNVRQACEIVRCEHKPRAMTRVNIYRQIEAPKKAAVPAKGKK